MKSKFFPLLFLAVFSFVSCTTRNKEKLSQVTTFAMDTYVDIKAYGDDDYQNGVLRDVKQFIADLDARLSVSSPDSDISHINSSDGSAVNVSDDTADLLSAALKYGDLTGGALDITTYKILREWGFTADSFKVPEQTFISDALNYVDYKNISLNGHDVILKKGSMLDLGALAKGYASDIAAEMLKNNGVDSAIIDLGGNIRTVGMKPDNEKWRISIRDPFDPSGYIGIVSIGDGAVVTSGNYERFFEDDSGKKYWHILDPKDGYPADNGIVSATIISGSGLYSDALSTAVLVMGKEKATELWKKRGDFEMILVTDDKEIIYTNGISERFDIESDMDSEVIVND